MKSTFTKKGHVTQRRKGVLARLRKQLVDGVKNATVVETNFAGITKKKTQLLPLTEADRTRISKEIKILEGRI